MPDSRFILNNHSNVAHRELDLTASLPLAVGDTLYTEEIPAGAWAERGFSLQLNTLNCQLEIVIEASYDKYSPRNYRPVFHPVLATPLEFTIASTATDPGILTFTTDFRGDWIKFKITNTGANPIDDLELVILLADNPDL